MLKETYIAKMKEMAAKKPEAVFIVVTRSAGHVLSPSWKLLHDYRERSIDWAQYTERFRREMDYDMCRKEMKRIWDLSQTKDVYLVCYEKPGQNCHRHLLMDIMHMRFGELRDTTSNE
ncbi:MAG: DUF488 family protein [Candidatus Methanoperedens sp.]|nr:DUF488 family protein [Candidatus Methanoperedens sp.]